MPEKWLRRVRAAAAVAVAALGLWGSSAVAAPPGTPDPSFAGDGVSELLYRGDSAEGRLLLPQPERLLVVGELATTTFRQGAVVIAGLRSNGAGDASFGSLTRWDDAGPSVAGAVLQPGGRIVVAVNGTPGGMYPERIRLLRFDAAGRLDPSFGAGGSVLLAAPGAASRLLQAPDGTLLVAGRNARAGALPDRAMLWRVSAAGTELGSAYAAIGTDQAGPRDVSAAVVLPGGATLVVGTDPGLFVARFSAAGLPDPAFGVGGIRRLPVGKVAVSDATLDRAARVLIAGARLGDLGRSIDAAIGPLLLRLSADGAVDRSLAAIGRGPGGDEDELTGVRVDASGRIYVASAHGRVVRLGRDGLPDLRFGVGGTSVPTRAELLGGNGLALSGGAALLTGRVFPARGNDTRLAVARIRLAGSGIVRPRARAWVQLKRRTGAAYVRVPISPRDQRLRRPIAVPLAPTSVSGGDGFFYTPPGTIVDATGATVTVLGSGGRATLRRGRFTLRRTRGRIALIVLAPPRCGGARTTEIALNGRFAVRTGRLTLRNVSRRARLGLRRRCGRRAQLELRSGRLRASRSGGR